MIASFAPGRVRIRGRSMRDAKEMAKVLKNIAKLPGFVSAQPNPNTGSVLISYDESALDISSAAELCAYVKKSIPSVSGYFTVASNKNKSFNRAMAASFAVCMISPFMGMMRLHKYSAFAFAGLIAKHMLDYKKQII